mmetsp:Transcript_4193/g.10614  ORF Transcript_4193/g.10614 Transcript_4193/m.10614 type:complete len:106 (+) Transcript_4193:1009-1326(+)
MPTRLQHRLRGQYWWRHQGFEDDSACESRSVGGCGLRVGVTRWESQSSTMRWPSTSASFLAAGSSSERRVLPEKDILPGDAHAIEVKPLSASAQALRDAPPLPAE